MDEVTRFPHIPVIAPQTAALLEYLRTKKEETATDAELERVAGGPTDPDGKYYNNLLSAIGILRRRYSQVWKRMKGENCVRRLNAIETSEFAQERTRSVRKYTNRTLQMMECHPLETVPEKDRPEYIARMSQNKMLAVLSDRKTTKQLTGIDPPKLDMKKLLDAVREG